MRSSGRMPVLLLHTPAASMHVQGNKKSLGGSAAGQQNRLFSMHMS